MRDCHWLLVTWLGAETPGIRSEYFPIRALQLHSAEINPHTRLLANF